MPNETPSPVSPPAPAAPPLGGQLRAVLGGATAASALLMLGTLLFLAGIGVVPAASLWVAGLIVAGILIVAAAIAYKLRRGVERPVRALAASATALARNDSAPTAPVHGAREYRAIASALNDLASQLRGERLQRQRAESLATAGRLAAGIAHELGNPLGAGTMAIELLRTRMTASPEATELLDRLDREITRAHRIARGLLDLARPRTPSLVRIDVNEAVRSAVRLLTDQGALRRHRLELQLDSASPIIFGLHHDLEQIFVAVLLNAADATPAGGRIAICSRRFPRAALEDGAVRRDTDPPLTIRPRTEIPRVRDWLQRVRPPAEVVNVVVADAGPGVPRELADRIFEPFFTTKGSGRGTGLGLTVAAALIESLKGTIWVDRAREGGAAFHLLFPVAVGEGPTTTGTPAGGTTIS
jgi:signal transduction histidine kinase